jgi:hypothetical protein
MDTRMALAFSCRTSRKRPAAEAVILIATFQIRGKSHWRTGLATVISPNEILKMKIPSLIRDVSHFISFVIWLALVRCISLSTWCIGLVL